MKKIQLGGHRKDSKIRAYALIDDEDYVLINKFKWCYSNHGYATRTQCISSNKDKKIYMHREIMKPKNKKCVDHINHNTLDNRKINLRVCSHSQNLMNRKNAQRIYWDKSVKTWKARIRKEGKDIYLGSSVNRELALDIRIKGEKRYFREFAPF